MQKCPVFFLWSTIVGLVSPWRLNFGAGIHICQNSAKDLVLVILSSLLFLATLLILFLNFIESLNLVNNVTLMRVVVKVPVIPKKMYCGASY